MEDVKGLTLRLPEALLDQLRRIAAEERRSLNSQIVATLDRFVKERQDVP